MPKREVITRTFGLVLTERCPQCGQLTKRRQITGSGEGKKKDFCPQCQEDLIRGSEPSMLPEVFGKFAKAVNVLIRRGIMRSKRLFTNDSLQAVKRFYDVLSNDQVVKQLFGNLVLQSRVQRCAAQYAYFAIREYKQRQQDIQMLVPVLAKELRQKGLCSIQGDSFPSNSLLKICWQRLRQDKDSTDDISWYELINLLRHIRNLLYRIIKTRLEEQEGDVVQKLTISEDQVKNLTHELEKIHQETTKDWVKTFVQRLSRLLTQRLKRNTNKNGLAWGQGYFDGLIEDILDQSVSIDPQGCVKVTQDQWQSVRKQWRDQLVQHLQRPSNSQEGKQLVQKALHQVKTQFTPGQVLKLVFKPKVHKFRYTTKPQQDWERYRVHKLVEQAVTDLIDRRKLDITELVLSTCRILCKKPQKWLKRPLYEAQSIPLGIDDNRVYKLGMERDPAINPDKESQHERPGEILVRLTFKRGHPLDFQVQSPKRWLELQQQGYMAKKPVVHKRPGGGALVLAVPFESPASVPPPVTNGSEGTPKISTSVDLGLKVLATLSITQDVVPVKWTKGTTFKELEDPFADLRVENHELARYFLDQAELARPVQAWFNNLPPLATHLPFTNLKRHLFQLREEVRRLQTKKDQYKTRHPKKYRMKVKYKRIKREWQRLWAHISGIHENMARQVATRIVSVSQAYQSQLIRFEVLKWAQTTAKEEAGYWLATWQVHWFHSEVIRHTRTLAARHGIRVELVVARGTSYRCSSCGRKGERYGKTFNCPHCHRQLNSDLNAARNIAAAPISPYAIGIRGELPYPVGNTG
ncbi:MAG: zinc ribbon domain-containing protein [Candidatus Hodarchaeota archaeon]